MSSEPEERDEVSGVPAVKGRRYGDVEIRRILRQAADLQEEAGAASDATGGLSLDEIRQIAREAGIDPRFVDLAAADSVVATGPGAINLAGAPTQWQFHSEVDGEVPEEARGRILQAIRKVTGQKGEAGDLYGRMEWTFDDGMGPTIFGLSSADGRTSLDLSVSRKGEPALYFGLGIPFGGVFGGALLSSAFGVSGLAALPFIGVCATAMYGVARLFWKARARAIVESGRRLMDAATSIARESAEEGE